MRYNADIECLFAGIVSCQLNGANLNPLSYEKRDADGGKINADYRFTGKKCQTIPK